MSDLPAGSTSKIKKKYILDSYAMLAYLLRQTGGAEVRDLLRRNVEGEIELYLSIINLGEVFYMAWKKNGQTTAQKAIRIIRQLPVKVVGTTERRTLRAARIKAQYSTSKTPFSFADCFAAVLAEEFKCPVVTGDPEFSAVEKLIAVSWLPKK